MSPTPATRPENGPRLGRRALLLVGAGATATMAAGCTLNNPFDSTKTPAAEAIGDLTPDVALAVTAVGALMEAETAAAYVLETFPGAPGVARLQALHRAHLDALAAAVPEGIDPRPPAPAATPARTRAAALTRQHQLETALHDRLTGLALRAESGPFARLLGSMAAAISQQLAAVPLIGSGR